MADVKSNDIEFRQSKFKFRVNDYKFIDVSIQLLDYLMSHWRNIRFVCVKIEQNTILRNSISNAFSHVVFLPFGH